MPAEGKKRQGKDGKEMKSKGRGGKEKRSLLIRSIEKDSNVARRGLGVLTRKKGPSTVKKGE